MPTVGREENWAGCLADWACSVVRRPGALSSGFPCSQPGYIRQRARGGREGGLCAECRPALAPSRGAVLAFVVYFDDKSYNRWPPDPRPRAPRGEKVGQAPGSVGSREHYRPYVGPRCIMAASRASPTRAGKLFRAESFPRCAPQQDWALPRWCRVTLIPRGPPGGSMTRKRQLSSCPRRWRSLR